MAAADSQLLYDEYAALTQKHKAEYGPDAVVLMEVGSFMEWYDCDRGLGADVQRICTLLNVQPTRKNKAIAQISRQNPAFSGFPRVALSKYVPVLVDAGMVVALAMQVTPPPNPHRRVVEVLSRATISGSSLLDAPRQDDGGGGGESPCMMAVFLESGSDWTSVGWAVVDVATGRTSASEVTGSLWHDAGRPLDALRRVHSAFSPSEIVFCRAGTGAIGAEQLRAHLGIGNRAGLLVERPRDVCCSIALQNAVLSRSFPCTGFLSPAEFVGLERMPCALSALVLALQFLHEHGGLLTSKSGVRLQQPEVVLENRHVHTSADAFRQLDVAPMLVRLLNRCTTPAGRRAFRDRLLNPVSCPAMITQALDAVDAELAGDRHERTRTSLSCVGDIERHFRRACVGRATGNDLLILANSARAAALAIREGGGETVARMAEEISALVTSHVELDPVTGRCGMVRGAFAEADAAEDELVSARQVFFQAAAALNSAIGSDHVRVLEGNDADGGMALSVTARRWATAVATGAASKAVVEPWFSGSDASMSTAHAGAPRLVHPALGAAASERVRVASARLAQVFSERMAELQSRLAESHTDSLWAIVRAIEALDIAATCARNARDYGLVRPKIIDRPDSGRSRFVALGLRHPIIENLRGRREAYVPNDVVLDGDTDEDGMRGMLLYGVNAVGKSSVMKAVGVAVVMAQAGMFVAADALELYPFNSILTRIGLRDDIAAGHSTFAVEMLELRAILHRAGRGSLVLGDELCAGTESASALAIVGSGVVQLALSGAAFVLATHLHELVELPQVVSSKGVRAMHLSVKHDAASGRLEMGRKLQPGPGMPTYGLEVCRSLDMGEDFIACADTIRRQVLGASGGNRPALRRSRYNASVIVGQCLVCGSAAEETHHIVPQASASAHVKNRAHNLAPLCSRCHDAVHAGSLSVEGFRMTSDGLQLVTRLSKDNIDHGKRVHAEHGCHDYDDG